MVALFEWVWENYRGLCISLLVIWGLYRAYTRPYSMGDPGTYATLIGAQLLLIAIFHYRKVFFWAVMISFLWAGMTLPGKGAWAAARWPVLVCAAMVGMVLWLKEERQHFEVRHMIALFCGLAAVTSAVVSAFPRTAFLKAMSLVLLFAYASGGARIMMLNIEREFTRGLVVVCEVTTYITAACYFVLRLAIFGNPNSLGAVTGTVLVPIAIWGVAAAETTTLRRRRILGLLVAVALLVSSRGRAGLLSGLAAACFLLLSMKSYRLFLRSLTIGVAGLALLGLWAPELISTSSEAVNSDVIYKGHRSSGLLASRFEPWNATMETIRQHPVFGGGYGTTPTGAEGESEASVYATSSGTRREHGSSYLELLEWVGLLGILPFIVLLGSILGEIRAVSRYLRNTLDASHPAVPLAMVCLAGLVGGAFEDWLFAVGYYLAVLFWCMAFCLADLTRRSLPTPITVAGELPSGRGAEGQRFAEVFSLR